MDIIFLYLLIYFYLFILAAPGLAAGGIFVAACELLVVACKLLVAACMRYLVPQPGIEPRPPALEAQSLREHRVLPTGLPGKSPYGYY